ncbi:unnamed protein product [Prorocentrum cordatum]|uniref:Uncharacterized protein n=1 Tax=Prorocentrum cordatum TaxID=2364126 RepID=A0ABN9TKI1_9DINO|nr:unnamed protein product [Polarella glacialis]
MATTWAMTGTPELFNVDELVTYGVRVPVSYNAGISACEKGGQWQRALALLSGVREAKLEPNVISYSAGISACAKGGQWQSALALFSEMWEAKLEPNSATALGSARARRAGSGSLRWLC